MGKGCVWVARRSTYMLSLNCAARYLLSAGLIVSAGHIFGLGACGGSRDSFDSALPLQADGAVPEDIAQQIRACVVDHRIHLGAAEHRIAFDVRFASDGEIDEMMLLGSTLRDEGLEACMASALRSLSAENLPVHRSSSGFHDSITPDSRAMLGQEQAILACLSNPPCLLTLSLFLGVTYITVLLYVHNIKTIPSPAPAPPTTPPEPEPPEPEPEPEPADNPKTTDPPPPPPPPPLPLPPRETCEERMANRIRCDDPKIKHYELRSETEAFYMIVRKKGKGLRKEKKHAGAESGPCVGRGGFHTNVLQNGDYVASIVGCICCDDAIGKALQKQRTAILYKQ